MKHAERLATAYQLNDAANLLRRAEQSLRTTHPLLAMKVGGVALAVELASDALIAITPR